ncbi:hypothetical protein [Kitasatospora sp. NPDC086791]|uniref:hypothetical protein n=1 Tax=Kitasatospora sp. NPDC086791 TaxID=3155178 RepID=UPI00343F17EC
MTRTALFPRTALFSRNARPPRTGKPLRTGKPPRSGRATALSGVLLVIALQCLAVGVAPGPLRLFLSGALIGASVAGLLLALLLATSRRRAGAAGRANQRRARDARDTRNACNAQEACDARGRTTAPGDDDAQWFSARSLEGFPMEQVRPLLLAPGAPGLNRLYTAWMFATHGHDPHWIAHHLDLPTPTARLLVTAARNRPTPGT